MGKSTKRRKGCAVLFLVLGLGLAISVVYWRPIARKLAFWSMHPGKAFSAIPAPAAPDYAKASSWAALPTSQEHADMRPAGSKVPKAPPQADTFFIHPTTYLSSKSWNAPLDAKKAKRRIDNLVMKMQASTFNGCCHVYAPRYRQATLAFAFDFEKNGKQALELAYKDVVRAFQYYLKTWNKGRPFILAGHSQGTIHALRLLEEHVVTSSIRKQLIAAYLVGNPVHKDKFARTLKPLVPCQEPSSTGCVVSWMTQGKAGNTRMFSRLKKYYHPKGYEDVSKRPHICTNPLSWKAQGPRVPYKAHRGSVPYVRGNKALPALTLGVVRGGCDAKGAMRIDPPNTPGFNRFIFGKDDYHIYDYNLFYGNIYHNAIVRTKAFLAKQTTQKGSTGQPAAQAPKSPSPRPNAPGAQKPTAQKKKSNKATKVSK